ncbi:hypothetical protein D3875_01480 [Deinococcus cavernae]|uniref:Fimbrial biogenesis outer membrane usher protein n=1 Tax=Deinococcus cavernae TaxID=2320857 RepID=A0A418VGI6_9DEIO|nr:hypothetical protein [Deinococcus cavernae]RJF75214.1 hypothetical protein D3875_01480 [Deinococcus cavernae]
MKRCPCPERRRTGPRARAACAGWLLAALLLGSALAQTSPPAAPSPPNAAQDDPLCAGTPELLDVTVSGLYRGVREVRRSAAGTLLEGSALSQSEDGYLARTVTCDGAALALLRPELQVQYDAQALSLVIRPQPLLLTSHTLDLAEVAQASGVSASPVYGLAYAVTADHTFPERPSPDQTAAGWRSSDQVALDAYAAQGRFSGYAGALARWDGERLGVQPRAAVSAEVGPGWQVSASYHADPFSVAGTLGDRDFWGVGLRGSNTGAQLDRLPITLPLDAEVSVLIDGVTITTVQAQAGELLLRSLPVLAGGSQVSVVVTDATGRRVLDRLTSGSLVALPPRGYTLEAQAGMEDGKPYGAAAATYGLSEHWQLLADGKWQNGQGSGSVQAAYVNQARQFSVGTSYDPERGVSVQGTYGRLLGRVALGLNASVPLGHPDLLSVGVNASVALARGSLYTQAVYQPASDLGPWALGAGGYYRVNDDLILGGFVQAQPGRQTAGVNLRWQLKPNLAVSTQATANLGRAGAGSLPDSAPTTVPTTAPPVTGRVGLTYAPSPGRLFSVSAALPDWQQSQLTYEEQRSVSAQVQLTPQGLHAGVAGVVSLVGGQVFTGREVSARTLLVRTGVPDVPLIVGGQPAVTDRRGNALVALDAAARQVSVNLYADALPVNVTVKSDSARLNVRGNGLITLDWRNNFEVSRWVQLFWKPGEVAANADLHLGAHSLPADPDGNVLLPQNIPTLSGTLQTQDGTRQCAMTLTSAGRATCLGQP